MLPLRHSLTAQSKFLFEKLETAYLKVEEQRIEYTSFSADDIDAFLASLRLNSFEPSIC